MVGLTADYLVWHLADEKVVAMAVQLVVCLVEMWDRTTAVVMALLMAALWEHEKAGCLVAYWVDKLVSLKVVCLVVCLAEMMASSLVAYLVDY